MRYWCLSTSQDNWKICREKGVWGMDARYLVTFETFLRAGDRAIVYTHGGRFTAVVEFVGPYYFSDTDIGWKKDKDHFLFPYRINFKILVESKIPPKISFSTEENGNKAKWTRPNLIDKVTFIADKGRTWNQYLQVSILRITGEDFDTLYEIISKS